MLTWLYSNECQLQSFAGSCRAVPWLSVLEKGAALYRIGDFPDGIYGVASGGIAAEIAPNESGPHFLHVFRAGSWFGEAALFDDGPRLVTMVATRPSHRLHLPRFELREVASMDPNTWRWLGVWSVAQLKLALGIIADLMIPPPGSKNRSNSTTACWRSD